MIRTLAKKLSALKQFKNFVMAEAVVERGAFQSTLEIERERGSLAVIRLSDRSLSMTVKLLMPCGDFLIPPTRPSKNPLGHLDEWRRYSNEEIKTFIEEVDDENEIHRGARPIVPGFLIIETLLNEPRLSEHKKIRLRFKHFTSVDEKLYLTIDGERFYVDADERKIEGWILDC